MAKLADSEAQIWQLTSEITKLTTERNRYVNALAPFWIEPDGTGEPCIWMNWRGKPVPVAAGSEMQIDLWAALTQIIPAREWTGEEVRTDG